MYAYSPNRSPIIGNFIAVTGVAHAIEGGFSRNPDGSLEMEEEGSTKIWWDDSRPQLEEGEMVYVDAESSTWRASEVILRATTLGEDDELGHEPIKFVNYTIAAPEAGFRTPASFTQEEKNRLRPIAETLALLDGNAFFGATRNDEGDDTFYEQYLPEAAALAESSGGWTSLASFNRGNTPLPETVFPWIQPVRFTKSGERIVDLVDKPTIVRHLTDINWDISDDDNSDDLKPALPAELYVGIEDDPEGDPDDSIVDQLSDLYGFCINSIGSIDPVDASEIDEPANKG